MKAVLFLAFGGVGVVCDADDDVLGTFSNNATDAGSGTSAVPNDVRAMLDRLYDAGAGDGDGA